MHRRVSRGGKNYCWIFLRLTAEDDYPFYFQIKSGVYVQLRFMSDLQQYQSSTHIHIAWSFSRRCRPLYSSWLYQAHVFYWVRSWSSKPSYPLEPLETNKITLSPIILMLIPTAPPPRGAPCGAGVRRPSICAIRANRPWIHQTPLRLLTFFPSFIFISRTPSDSHVRNRAGRNIRQPSLFSISAFPDTITPRVFRLLAWKSKVVANLWCFPNVWQNSNCLRKIFRICKSMNFAWKFVLAPEAVLKWLN